MSWLVPSLERRRIREEMLQLPALAVSTAEGEVVVATGTVRALGEALVAPLSQRRCAWFQSTVETFDERGSQRFLLEREGTSSIIIDPTHAHVALAALPHDAFDNHRARSVRLEHRGPDALTTIVETIVEIGARISVAGILAREVAGVALYRDAPSDVLLVGREDAPLVIVDQSEV